jgi:hypothetical protein
MKKRVLFLVLALAAAAGAQNGGKVTVKWNGPSRVSKTSATLQVVVNPPLRRGSGIHDTAFSALADLKADYVRYVPWLPYPKLGVAELEPPGDGTTSWDFSLIDPLTVDFLKATAGHPVVLNFSTIPQWMWATPQRVAYPKDPDKVTWNYQQGTALRDPSMKELGDYYGRLVSWYTRGGFTDELGKRHESGHEFKISHWEVLNEVDFEHNMSAATYTGVYDAIVESIRKVAPGMKFVALGLAAPAKAAETLEYFLNPANHRPGIPLDYISYHFYASPSADESPEVQQFTFFAQAESFLNTVRFIEAIRRRLSPGTGTMINEVGAISAEDGQQGRPDYVFRPIPDSYWNLCGAMYAYLYGQLANIGIDTVGASQLVGYPTQFPSVSLVDWNTGRPNPRLRVLQLLKDNFGPGDQLIETGQPNPFVYAQAFVDRKGARKILLVNKRDRPFDVAIPDAEGKSLQYVDRTTGFGPPASARIEGGAVHVSGYMVAVVNL